jgi:SSS family transporter
MQLSTLDWSIIIGFFAVTLLIGLWVAKTAGKSSDEFFLSGRSMPWWLLGVSMVATTFSADTPNLVAGIVRKDGIAGNWVWWAFLLTGMVTVFIYSRMWRRLGITTDLEFYELRYRGKAAAILRGFRAIYLGVFFNIFIMATVCLAGVKIGHTLLGLSHWETLGIASIITVVYSLIGGFRGVILTDFFQFIIAMIGSIAAAWFVLDMPQVGGLDGLLSNPAVQEKLNFIPDESSDTSLWMSLFIIPLAVQWWSVWYPGSEPGGGGYIAQRVLAAKDEKHAVWATLFFNFAHYALRPWPWIIVALASIVVFPEIADIKRAFPGLQESYYQHDLAYPAMLTYLPAGLLGLVLASLIAAFMSTISTHLNWGSSYVVNDFYKRFANKNASEKQLVVVGRISTVIMMVCAALLSVVIEEASEGFHLIMQIGAGTGLLFILRWFWKAINPWSEISAMIISFVIAIFFFINGKMEAPMVTIPPGQEYWQLIVGVGITTVGWVLVTLLTAKSHSTDASADQSYQHSEFDKRAFGVDANQQSLKFHNMGYKVLAVVLGCVAIYSALFSAGKYLFGQNSDAMLFGACFVISTTGIVLLRKKFL